MGYAIYKQRVAAREDQYVHSLGNMVELERARLALDLAAIGKRVVVVSSEGPGVFGMATALIIGHDFAVLSLSDCLKPWDTIAQRVQALL